MIILSRGPNINTLYHYMRCKGYQPNYSVNSGKRDIIFTKEIHSAQFPKLPCLKGLTVVHKIKMDVQMGCVQKHWIENRGLPITCWDYIHTLEELQEQAIKAYNMIKQWCRKDWLYEAIKDLEKRGSKKQAKKEGK